MTDRHPSTKSLTLSQLNKTKAENFFSAVVLRTHRPPQRLQELSDVSPGLLSEAPPLREERQRERQVSWSWLKVEG